MTRLGLVPGASARLRTAAGGLDTQLSTLDLELRSRRTVYRWSARVGFGPRTDNLALLGPAGFLDHFTVIFDGLLRRVTLRPNGTFPSPSIDE
jgi:hypothetical protein